MSLKRFLFYFLFLALAFPAALFFRFPAEPAEGIAVQRLSAAWPGMSLSVKEQHLVFPFGLRFNSPGLTLGEGTRLDISQLTLPLADLILSRNTLHFSAALNGGTLKGEVQNDGQQKVHLEQVAFSDVPCSIEGADVRISLTLSGSLHGTASPLGLEGELHIIRIKADHSPLKDMGMDPLTFDRATVRFKASGNTIDILEFQADGQMMTLNLKGQLSFSDRYPASLPRAFVELTGDWQPKPAYVSKFSGTAAFSELFTDEGKMPVRVTGTLSRPEVML